MRILFTTISEHSHILAQTPMAWALATAGHDVRLASAPAMTDVITSAGLTAVPVGTDHNMHEMLAQLSQQGAGSIENELSDWSEPSVDKQTWQGILFKYQVTVPMALAPYNDPIVEELVEFAKSWRPDLIVWDPLTYAGAVAATVIGVPHARLLWTVDIYAAMREAFLELRDQQAPAMRQDPLADWLGNQLAAHGKEFTEEVVTGHFTLDPIPDSIQLPPTGNRVPLRYTPYNGRSVVPRWAWEENDRPRVVVTSGSSFEAALGATFLPFSDVLAGLADLDVDVVTTLSEAEKDKLGTLPDNVRAVGFVPMQVLLPTCSAVVHHGGFGTWSTAALAGVPQLVTTIRHGDLWLRAQRTEEIGAGLRLHGPSVTPESARAAVVRLLEEPGFQAGAAKLREEVLAMPTTASAVADVERLTNEHRAVLV
ncbi:activator-dependent family glycosyltransferase [Actinophytocola oryzae]|uniref:Glycosyltransferase (Activator-dependent family) n=1 Tax=Actinophytocola oryzae TaxID=502181 RepID=A0A4R7UTT8_9PSEU|nr:activator-dependent family glycosyltransferase [Actinophytocola oryzae]TDV38579.1 glycosyltransferase (activator-dependent family) [Actinophytocola oryzae]